MYCASADSPNTRVISYSDSTALMAIEVAVGTLHLQYTKFKLSVFKLQAFMIRVDGQMGRVYNDCMCCGMRFWTVGNPSCIVR